MEIRARIRRKRSPSSDTTLNILGFSEAIKSLPLEEDVFVYVFEDRIVVELLKSKGGTRNYNRRRILSNEKPSNWEDVEGL